MNKSYEYIKSRIENKDKLKDGFNVSVKDLKLVKLPEVGEEFCNQIKKPLAVAKIGDIPIAYLTYKPRASYNYFITRSIITDGMLVPPYELLKIIIDDICNLKTFCTVVPHAGEVNHIKNADELKKYEFHYDIGDLVISDVIRDKSPDSNRPWLTYETFGMLPCRFSITKKE